MLKISSSILDVIEQVSYPSTIIDKASLRNPTFIIYMQKHHIGPPTHTKTPYWTSHPHLM